MQRAHLFGILAIVALAGCASQSNSSTRSNRTSRGSADAMYAGGSRSTGPYGGSSYEYGSGVGIRHDWRPEWGTRTCDWRSSTDGNQSYGSSTYNNGNYNSGNYGSSAYV